jgi:hypothetical protein
MVHKDELFMQFGSLWFFVGGRVAVVDWYAAPCRADVRASCQLEILSLRGRQSTLSISPNGVRLSVAVIGCAASCPLEVWSLRGCQSTLTITFEGVAQARYG